jgi:hypothetical protein
LIAPLDPREPITPEMDEELRAAHPDPLRIRVAMQLARDVEAFRDLYAGQPVDPARLNPAALAKARRRSLVHLAAPVDLVQVADG